MRCSSTWRWPTPVAADIEIGDFRWRVRKRSTASPDNYPLFQNVFAGIYQSEGDDAGRAMTTPPRRSVELHPAQVWPYERMARLLMDEGSVRRGAWPRSTKRFALWRRGPGTALLHCGFAGGSAASAGLRRSPGSSRRLPSTLHTRWRISTSVVASQRSGRFEEARSSLGVGGSDLDTHPVELASAETAPRPNLEGAVRYAVTQD